MEKSTIRVLIADDHDLVRRGLRNILGTDPKIRIVGEASDGAEALDKALKKRPDVVVLDLSMPRKNGLEVTEDLKEQLPETTVLILSVHSEAQFAVPAMNAGADAYIRKEHAAEKLLTTIRRLAIHKN